MKQILGCLAVLLIGTVPAGAVEVEQLLLEDADSAVVVNVRNILAAAAVQKHYGPLIQMGLKSSEEIQKVLQAAGFDPLKDVERITMVQGASSYRQEARNEPNRATASISGGPLLIIQGKFDLARIRPAAEQLARDNPGRLKIQPGEPPLYIVTGPVGRPGYLAFVDGTMAVAGTLESQVVDALKRASSPNQTKLQYPEMARLYAGIARTPGVGLAAIGPMVFLRSSSSSTVNGKTTVTTNQTTLRQLGFEAITGEITLGEKVQARATVVATDAEKAATMVKAIETGLEKARAAIPMEKALEPAAEALKTVKVTAKDSTIQLEAEGGPDLVALPLLILAVNEAGPPKPAPVPVPQPRP